MCDRFDISIIGPHDFAASRYINPEKNGERNHFIATDYSTRRGLGRLPRGVSRPSDKIQRERQMKSPARFCRFSEAQKEIVTHVAAGQG